MALGTIQAEQPAQHPARSHQQAVDRHVAVDEMNVRQHRKESDLRRRD